MGYSDNQLINMVDETTRLAGSNKMELLLFTLGGKETYAINVFKVREVCETPSITRTPNMPHGVEGITSLRGSIIPIINLGRVLGVEMEHPSKLIITEFSGHTQGFLAQDVDRIIRVSWDKVKAPEAMLTGLSSTITAITELADGKLISILDVEQILHDVIGEESTPSLNPIVSAIPLTVFFADDSAFARKKIIEVLDQLGLKNQQARNGRDALNRLQAIAARAEHEGVAAKSLVNLILLDAEMPEMDGYVLTRRIKEDRRFAGIPVVMHSSLSSAANRSMGEAVGVDAYVAKFDPAQLAATIRRMLHVQDPS
jgi:two-component system, chemotaxis family, chemotaxis protein CheV